MVVARVVAGAAEGGRAAQGMPVTTKVKSSLSGRAALSVAAIREHGTRRPVSGETFANNEAGEGTVGTVAAVAGVEAAADRDVAEAFRHCLTGEISGTFAKRVAEGTGVAEATEPGPDRRALVPADDRLVSRFGHAGRPLVVSEGRRSEESKGSQSSRNFQELFHFLSFRDKVLVLLVL